MVVKLGCVVLALGLVLSWPAAGYFSETELQTTHPELLIPGRVGVVTNVDTAYYVYSGGVRKNHLMDAPRLKTVATLRAENALARHVRGTRPTDVVIRSALQVAKIVRGTGVTYVFAVPVDGVSEVERKLQFPVADMMSDKFTRANEAIQTNKVDKSVLSSGTGEVKSDGKSLLELVDAVERDPESVDCRIALVDAYLKDSCYDEATRECGWIVDRLSGSKAVEGHEVDVLVRAAEALYSMGEYRLARKAFSHVRFLQNTKYHQRALQVLSEIQLKVGLE